MTAGRKKSAAAPEATTIDMATGALVEAGRALAEQSAELMALQQKCGLDDLSPTTLVREVKVWMHHTATASFEVGIRLVALRQQCPQGEWVPLLRDELQIAPRSAQRYMSMALKCVGRSGPREKLLQLDRSKVIELVSLDDDALDELDKTGRLSQMALELDEIDRMSTTELRQRLREREQTIAAKDKVLSKKDERINRLEERLERPYTPTAESEAASAEEQALLEGIRAAAMEAHAGLLKLAAAARDLSQGALPDALRRAAHTDVQWLAQRLAELAAENGIALDMEEVAQPAWLQPGKKRRA